MKRVLMLFVALSMVVLSGCSVSGVRERVDGWVDALISKDQQRQQGFVLTSAEVYASYDSSIGFIDLADKGLTAVPDFCSLLLPEDHDQIIIISLMGNAIKIVNQDLSCLTNLSVLNISYNGVTAVTHLGDLPSLKELYLHKNEIASTNGFPTFPALERLSLSYNNLKEVGTEITSISSLEILDLAHNQLETIVGVERLEKLEQLRVEFNALREIESISDLKNLELVTAKGNQLKEGVIETLDQFNQGFVERNLGAGASNIGTAIIREIEAGLGGQ